MKLTLSIILIIGAAAIAQSLSEKPIIVKPAKEEMPEVIVKNRKREEASFTMSPACTRDLPPGATMSGYSDHYEYVDENGTTQMTKHCNKCNAGVYAPHEGQEFKTCSFCGEKE